MAVSKTRIAPTPSGYLHPGNLANFLFTAALVPVDGELLLRIDDLDRGRFRSEYLSDIFRVLEELSITVTEGPESPTDFTAAWSQVLRMPLYQTALDTLAGHPLLFACRCSRKELTAGHHPYGCLSEEVRFDAPNAAWRLKTHELTDRVIIERLIGPAAAIDLHQLAPHIAVRRRTGAPSYQLASVVDDLHFGVTTVARGVDLLTSTATQQVVAELLGRGEAFSKITFVHHPLMLDGAGGKLSKSSGSQSQPYPLTAPNLALLRSTVATWLDEL